MSMSDCPVCEGPAYLLGTLGRLNHYKCRDCGMMYHVETSKDRAASSDDTRPDILVPLHAGSVHI